MTKKIAITGIFLLCLLVSPVFAAIQDGATLGTAKFNNSEALIQTLLLVCEKGVMRYSLSGGSEKGLISIEILSGEKIINHADCNGAKQCRISGSVSMGSLDNSMVIASVRSSENKEQREKIKVGMQGNETKVYLISTIPDLTGIAPVMIAENETGLQIVDAVPKQHEKEPEASKEIRVAPAKGPAIDVNLIHNGHNDFTLNISAKDDTGIDFIEILENNVFMDVEICDKKPICTFKKNIKNRKTGEYKYLIKTMNIKDGLSFQEETITFSE